MIFVALGPDAAMCRTETLRIAAEYDPSGTNITRADGKSVRLADAIAMASTPAFLGSARVIVIEDLLARSTRGADSSEPYAEVEAPRPEKSAINLRALFESVNPENVLVLSDPSLASLPTTVAKLLPKDTKVIVGDPPRGQALLQWIEDQAEAHGNRIERSAAQFLAELLFPQTWSTKPSNPRYDRPPDLDQLGNEIAKLALYAYPRPVSQEDIRVMTGAALADRLFSFVEQSVAGNLANAVRDLESFDIHGNDAHRAVNQLYQQIELSAVLASAQSSDPTVVGRDLGLTNPQGMFGVARAPRPKSPLKTVDEAAKTDRAIKTGRLKGVDDAIYVLITAQAEGRRQTQERRGRS